MNCSFSACSVGDSGGTAVIAWQRRCVADSNSDCELMCDVCAMECCHRSECRRVVCRVGGVAVQCQSISEARERS